MHAPLLLSCSSSPSGLIRAAKGHPLSRTPRGPPDPLVVGMMVAALSHTYCALTLARSVLSDKSLVTLMYFTAHGYI